MTLLLIALFFITIIQNASFTLVSRARNSGSYIYNAIASVFSNGIWFIVVQQVVAKPNDIRTGIAYVLGATIGSVLMQWVAIKFLEKKKPVTLQSPTVGRIVLFHTTDGEFKPAIIEKVWNATMVDVRIFDAGLNRKTSVIEGPMVSQWSWPKISK